MGTGSRTDAPAATTEPKMDEFKDVKKSATKLSYPGDNVGAQLSGVPLIVHKCRKKEMRWKNCVKNFYTAKFLPGESMDQETYCGETFEKYRRCYVKGLQVEIWDKKGTKPAEYSYLAQFQDAEEE
jgi:Uncharacterised protein family (UPF0203)